MRKRLNNEIVPNPTTPNLDSNSNAGGNPKKTAAAIAAEVADKLYFTLELYLDVCLIETFKMSFV